MLRSPSQLDPTSPAASIMATTTSITEASSSIMDSLNLKQLNDILGTYIEMVQRMDGAAVK